MSKSIVFKGIVLLFTVFLLSIISCVPAVASEESGLEDYYLLTEDVSYMIENSTNDSVKINRYSKSDLGEYVEADNLRAGYIRFDSNDTPKQEDLMSCNLTVYANEKVLIGSWGKDKSYLKVPSCCKVTKLEQPFWSNYKIKKGNSIKLMQSVKKIEMDVAITNNEDNNVRYESRYYTNRGMISLNDGKDYDNISIRRGEEFSIYADYDDVVLHMPTYFKNNISIITLNHPFYRYYVLKKGENLMITYDGPPFNEIRKDNSDGKIDYFTCDDWSFIDSKYVYNNNYYNASSLCCEFRNNVKVGIAANYGSDVTIKIPYEDYDRYTLKVCAPIFKTFTIAPNAAMKITNPDNDTLKVGLSDNVKNYYYEEYTSKDDSFLINSTNSSKPIDSENTFTSESGDYEFLIKSNSYAVIKNPTDSPRSFRLPYGYSDYVSDYVQEHDSNYDLNNDNFVDLQDLSLLASNYNVSNTNTSFNNSYDLNNDGICDIYDIVILSNYMSNM